MLKFILNSSQNFEIFNLYIMNKTITFFFISIIFFSINCDTKREALGADNEIRVICSNIDEKIIKSYLSQIFSDTLFSPEPEPYYQLKFSTPETYNQLKKQSKVIVAAVNRDRGNPGLKLVERILPNENLKKTLTEDPVILMRNVYAKNQLFMVINAISETILNGTIQSKKNAFRKEYNDQFISRQNNYLGERDRNISLEDSIFNDHGWEMNIPWGWISIKNIKDSNFVWLGKEMPFQWIGVNWINGDYVSTMDKLEVGRYIWDWPKKFYGNIQFNDYKFNLDETSFNGSTAWRSKGVWETIDKLDPKGGPFCSYLFYDNITDRTFYINYLIHHPGNDKSIYMRKLDQVVRSINTNIK